MSVKMLSSAVLAASLLAGGAQAQTLAQIGGPANLPPKSYRGMQFVDARGCLFLRAGFGGSTGWVARVDYSHKPICGMVPTGSAAAQAAVTADMAPDPKASAPQVAAKTAAVAAPVAEAPSAPQKNGTGLAWLFGTAPEAPAPKVAAMPAPVAPAAPSYQADAVATFVSGVQCYANAPKLESVNVTGGTALVCTRGDGSTNGWRPPMIANATQAQVAAKTAPAMAEPVAMPAPVVMPAQIVQVAPIKVAPVQIIMPKAPAPQSIAQTVALQPSTPQPVKRAFAVPKPPKGWVMAWQDDRLNPMRGIGTAQGQAQQDQIWTRTVPMVLVGDPLPKQSGLGGILGMHVAVSTMSAPQSLAGTGATATSAGQSIQIGSFSDPANAAGAMAQLAALGLSVSTFPTKRNGKVYQVVSAGPFGSAAEANAGLADVRGAGFSDAYLR